MIPKKKYIFFDHFCGKSIFFLPQFVVKNGQKKVYFFCFRIGNKILKYTFFLIRRPYHNKKTSIILNVFARKLKNLKKKNHWRKCKK